MALTAREWRLLECLVARQGRIVSRASLLYQVWGNDSKGASNSLEVLMGRIRKKLGPDWVRTIRSEGYALGFDHALPTPAPAWRCTA